MEEIGPSLASLPGLIDIVPCGLLLFDDDGVILDLNDTLAGLLGTAVEQLRQRPIDVIFQPGGKIFYQTHFSPLLRSSGHLTEIYFALKAADGHEIPVLINASRIASGLYVAAFTSVSQRQQFEGALIEARSLEQEARAESERISAELDHANASLRAANEGLRETEEALRNSNTSKDEFIGLVAHELKNPVSVLSGTVGLLARKMAELPAETAEQLLAGLQIEFDRLLAIIDDLLVVARSSIGSEVELEPVLIQRVVEGLVRRRWPESESTLELRLDPALPPALASAGLVEQIVANLITNAQKYGRDGAPILVSVNGSSDGILVTVSNDGAPLSEADVSRFFEPFYRAVSSETKARGLGLGLTVCQRLAEAQHATLEARPRTGGGLEVTLSLPAATV